MLVNNKIIKVTQKGRVKVWSNLHKKWYNIKVYYDKYNDKVAKINGKNYKVCELVLDYYSPESRIENGYVHFIDGDYKNTTLNNMFWSDKPQDFCPKESKKQSPTRLSFRKKFLIGLALQEYDVESVKKMFSIIDIDIELIEEIGFDFQNIIEDGSRELRRKNYAK